MNILVLDGNQNQAVASVRSLARAGHTVFAGEAASWSKASWSRACLAAFRYPSPKGPIDAFLQAIAAFVREMPRTLVLPMTELTTLLLSANRDFVISAGARLVLPDHSDQLRAFDKSETTRLAASLGIAAPKTVLVTNPEQALEAAQCMRFPVVLKPLASEQLSRTVFCEPQAAPAMLGTRPSARRPLATSAAGLPRCSFRSSSKAREPAISRSCIMASSVRSLRIAGFAVRWTC
jgi:predicted ATP-grasp superfamily ATP-dependent carboligase